MYIQYCIDRGINGSFIIYTYILRWNIMVKIYKENNTYDNDNTEYSILYAYTIQNIYIISIYK